MKFSNEMISKIYKATSAEEIAELLKAEGEDESLAGKIWQKLNAKKEHELSLDELEAVSGGADRDWIRDGCAATVEPNSWCWDNDDCVWVDVTYIHGPVDIACPNCRGLMYHLQTVSMSGGSARKQYKCTRCGYVHETV